LVGYLWPLRLLGYLNAQNTVIQIAADFVKLGLLRKSIAARELAADMTMFVGSFFVLTLDQELIVLIVHRDVDLLGLELLAIQVYSELVRVVLNIRESLSALDWVVLATIIERHEWVAPIATTIVKGTKAKVLIEDAAGIVERVPVVVAKKLWKD